MGKRTRVFPNFLIFTILLFKSVHTSILRSYSENTLGSVRNPRNSYKTILRLDNFGGESEPKVPNDFEEAPKIERSGKSIPSPAPDDESTSVENDQHPVQKPVGRNDPPLPDASWPHSASQERGPHEPGNDWAKEEEEEPRWNEEDLEPPGPPPTPPAEEEQEEPRWNEEGWEPTKPSRDHYVTFEEYRYETLACYPGDPCPTDIMEDDDMLKLKQKATTQRKIRKTTRCTTNEPITLDPDFDPSSTEGNDKGQDKDGKEMGKRTTKRGKGYEPVEGGEEPNHFIDDD